MDLRREIAQSHSKSQILRIVRYVGSNPERFKALINNYLTGPYRVTQKASWLISCCIEEHPELMKPHFKKLLNFVDNEGVHDSIKRNTMRMLQFVEIPEKYKGQVIALSFNFLQNKKEAVAIKVFSMTVLSQIIQDQPDLKRELRLIIEDQLPFSTPAFISRSKKILRKL